MVREEKGMNKTTYYVEFKDEEGNMRKEYIKARNNSAAVERAKSEYGAVSIYKSGKSRNEKSGYEKLFGTSHF